MGRHIIGAKNCRKDVEITGARQAFRASYKILQESMCTGSIMLVSPLDMLGIPASSTSSQALVEPRYIEMLLLSL